VTLVRVGPKRSPGLDESIVGFVDVGCQRLERLGHRPHDGTLNALAALSSGKGNGGSEHHDEGQYETDPSHDAGAALPDAGRVRHYIDLRVRGSLGGAFVPTKVPVWRRCYQIKRAFMGQNWTIANRNHTGNAPRVRPKQMGRPFSRQCCRRMARLRGLRTYGGDPRGAWHARCLGRGGAVAVNGCSMSYWWPALAEEIGSRQ